MSAAELIEQIKALPPAELEMVRSFLLSGETPSDRPAVQYMSNEKFEAASAHVFEVHHELLRKLAE